jgi:hypothetical protein
LDLRIERCAQKASVFVPFLGSYRNILPHTLPLASSHPSIPLNKMYWLLGPFLHFLLVSFVESRAYVFSIKFKDIILNKLRLK